MTHSPGRRCTLKRQLQSLLDATFWSIASAAILSR
jgi:hypothetical protein